VLKNSRFGTQLLKRCASQSRSNGFLYSPIYLKEGELDPVPEDYRHELKRRKKSASRCDSAQQFVI